MITPAKRLQTIEEYVFATINKEIKAVEQKTKRKVLNFGQGQPDLKPGSKAIKKLQQFISEDDAHLYPGYKAIPVLSEALKQWYKKRFNVTLENDELQPLLGGKDGIAHLPLALFNKGDEVLMPDPGYPPYKDPTLLVGAKPVFYDLVEKEEFKINIKGIEKKITKKTKAIWLNFPSNPTGQIVTIEELNMTSSFCMTMRIQN
jgi:LL-diaminopimelate aminotransferase